MKSQETKKYLLAKLKLAQNENQLLKNEVLSCDFDRVSLLKENEILTKEKEFNNEFKKDYIDSYKHMREMEKAKFAIKLTEKETIAAILPIGLQIIADLAKNMMEETKVEVKVTPCPIKPVNEERTPMFGQDRRTEKS